MGEILEVQDGVGGFQKLPRWGVHRIVSEVDQEAPTKRGAGVTATEWKSVWVEVAFAEGAKTGKFNVYFWSPAASIEVDPETGAISYVGGYVAEGGVEDIEVVEGDAGHKTVLVVNNGRSFWLNAAELGANAVAHLLVAGCERVLV